ncbi:MAG: transporter [Oscillospiraceae bacterium]|nr:transporter [Oscillospiraceae bacterium]
MQKDKEYKKHNKLNMLLDKITYYFEVGFTFFILVVVTIKGIELISGISGYELVIINAEFDRVLSAAFALVIGVEFTKMLYKHTPETIIDVLLFAIARQTVIYHTSMLDMLIGVVAIGGLFAAKHYFIYMRSKKKNSVAREIVNENGE